MRDCHFPKAVSFAHSTLCLKITYGEYWIINQQKVRRVSKYIRFAQSSVQFAFRNSGDCGKEGMGPSDGGSLSSDAGDALIMDCHQEEDNL